MQGAPSAHLPSIPTGPTVHLPGAYPCSPAWLLFHLTAPPRLLLLFPLQSSPPPTPLEARNNSDTLILSFARTLPGRRARLPLHTTSAEPGFSPSRFLPGPGAPRAGREGSRPHSPARLVPPSLAPRQPHPPAAAAGLGAGGMSTAGGKDDRHQNSATCRGWRLPLAVPSSIETFLTKATPARDGGTGAGGLEGSNRQSLGKQAGAVLLFT